MDVSRLVGITPIYLNALIARKLYGVAASISDRHGEIKLRIFSEDDVFGIALVWMLFESGLRTQSIREILLQLVQTDEPDASAAAEFIRVSEISHLAIIRARTKAKKSSQHRLKVEPTDEEHLDGLLLETVQKYPTATMLVVPVWATFAEVANKIGLMFAG
jgi:hypothetical protein